MGSISESIMFSIQKSNLQGIRFVGMGCDPMVDMFHSGQMEKPKEKTDFSILAVELMGTQKIMDFAHNNPAVQVVSSRIGHNSSILSKLDKFVSINSAIEIDLSGQVNSETVDSRQISGIGGSIDYAETAFQSNGGVRITALASTAKKGTVSTIVPRLSSESAVTIPRGLAEFVVTEHGVADLRGKTMKERAENLIRIADPAFRQELEESVNTKGYR
jgi:acyl-CoA hydrolase